MEKLLFNATSCSNAKTSHFVILYFFSFITFKDGCGCGCGGGDGDDDGNGNGKQNKILFRPNLVISLLNKWNKTNNTKSIGSMIDNIQTPILKLTWLCVLEQKVICSTVHDRSLTLRKHWEYRSFVHRKLFPCKMPILPTSTLLYAKNYRRIFGVISKITTFVIFHHFWLCTKFADSTK